jgi:hypothetical protein
LVLRSTVGFADVDQQTPFTDTSEPPLFVQLPPLVAVVCVIADGTVVVIVASDAIVTLSVLTGPEPHALFAITEIVPPLAPATTFIEVEDELPLQPEGKVQVYEVAPVTAEILYVCEAPGITVVAPEIVPGCAGIAFTVTLKVLAEPEPHVLLAVTEIVPPADPGVAEIDVAVELPLHPEGNVHVYDVAPDTADIL